MVVLEYVSTGQEVLLPSLEYRGNPTVQMSYLISRVALDHQKQDKERTVEVLSDVCGSNRDQYNWTVEAIGEDINDSKRARIYANEGLIYTETCIRKCTKQLPNASMPEPLALPPTVQGYIKENYFIPFYFIYTNTLSFILFIIKSVLCFLFFRFTLFKMNYRSVQNAVDESIYDITYETFEEAKQYVKRWAIKNTLVLVVVKSSPF